MGFLYKFFLKFCDNLISKVLENLFRNLSTNSFGDSHPYLSTVFCRNYSTNFTIFFTKFSRHSVIDVSAISLEKTLEFHQGPKIQAFFSEFLVRILPESSVRVFLRCLAKNIALDFRVFRGGISESFNGFPGAFGGIPGVFLNISGTF